MQKGTIVTFNKEKKFGFIQPDTGGKNVFFHLGSFKGEGCAPAKGMPVVFESEAGEKGPKAVVVCPVGSANSESDAEARLVVFETFFNDAEDDGKPSLKPEIFFDAARKTARALEQAGLKSASFRKVYHSLHALEGQFTTGRLSFDHACAEFGRFYAEKIVYAAKRKIIPGELLALVDYHKDLVLSDSDEMQAFCIYMRAILCYFDPDK